MAVTALRPDSALALNNIAWLRVKLGKPGAVGVAEKANALAPGNPAIMDTLALALSEDKQIAKALEIQKKALALQPENPALRLNLAKLYIKSGDKLLARAELDQLTKLGDTFAGKSEVADILKSL
jgi:predicted Zn-dependent protease